MKATELKKKFPITWKNVYDGMISDLLSCMPQADVQQWRDGNENCRIERIAYNASFFACYEVYKKCKSQFGKEQIYRR